ncbi:MAG: zinc-binding dehydrogenase [Candidatus Thorarchaeota archaeon]
MKHTMRCIVIEKDGNVQLTKRPSPSSVPSSSSLLRVLLAGICSTDLAVLDNRIPGPRPLVMGHEFVAEAVDDATRRLCVSEINLSCGTCIYCNKGIPKHCQNRTALGISADGVFADYVLVPSENIHFLPATITPEQGVFVEPLAAAIQSLQTGNLSPEMSVGVLGTGRLGLLQIQVLKAVGFRYIVAISRSPAKLALAKRFGATTTLAAEKLRNADLLLLDAVIETSGSPHGLQMALELVRSQGTIVLKSTPGIQAHVNLDDIVRREIRLLGSRCGPFSEAIKLLASGQIQTEPLISGIFALEDFQKAFELARQPLTIKVLFDIAGRPQ